MPHFETVRRAISFWRRRDVQLQANERQTKKALVNNFSKILMSKLKGIIFTFTGSLLLAACIGITLYVNHALSVQTGSTEGVCYQADYPLPFVKNGGFHNHFRFVDNKAVSHKIYESTLTLYKVGDKVPIRYNPDFPENQVSAGSIIDVYAAPLCVGAIGIIHLSAGLWELLRKGSKTNLS